MITHGKNIKIFAANSNPGVAKQIADALGIPCLLYTSRCV